MAEKKITRKVIKPSKKDSVAVEKAPSKEVSGVEQVEEGSNEDASAAVRTGGAPGTGGAYGAKKVCFFCKSKTDPIFTDTAVLRRFTTDRAKIIPRAKSSLCSRHQRVLTRHIKYARHLALLPFVPQV